MKKTVKDKRREPWLDVCKGIAIILVVAGHVVTSYRNSGLLEDAFWFNYTGTLIYSFHMPLFFVISGYLAALSSNKENPRRAIRKNLIAYGVPYIIFSLLAWSLKFVAATVVNNKVTLGDLGLLFIFPINAMWFLYALLIISVVQLCVDRIIKTRLKKVFWLILTFVLGWIGALLAKNEQIQEKGLEQCIIFDVVKNYFWYAIGFYAVAVITSIERRATAFRQKIGGGWRYLISVVLLFGAIAYVFLPLVCDYRTFKNFEFVVSAGIASIGVTLSFLVSMLVCGFVFWLEKLGTLTLPIYLLHGYVISALRVCFSRLEIPLYNGLIPMVLGTILAVAIPCLFYELGKRLWVIDFCFYPAKYKKV